MEKMIIFQLVFLKLKYVKTFFFAYRLKFYQFLSFSFSEKFFLFFNFYYIKLAFLAVFEKAIWYFTSSLLL